MLSAKFDKRKNCISSVLLLLLLILGNIFFGVALVSAQSDFIAYRGGGFHDGQIDGYIDSSDWNDAGYYPSVALAPSGTGELWIKHSAGTLFIALKFTADSSNPWVGIQYQESVPMASGADGSIFGNDNLGSGYVDVTFGGEGVVSADSSQDGVGYMYVTASNVVSLELKKPLSSGDSGDIAWDVGNSYNLTLIWDSDGGGSSEGSADHQSGSIENISIFLNPDVIPEFSALIMTLSLIATTLLVIIYKRKSILQHSKN
jgi:hypothetical protein